MERRYKRAQDWRTKVWVGLEPIGLRDREVDDLGPVWANDLEPPLDGGYGHIQALV